MKLNKTYFQIFGLGLVIFFISSCEKVEPLRISNEIYSLELWSDWSFQQRQGYDTYVGVFTNGDEEIKVDCGELAFISLDLIQETQETTYFEETIIDNSPAKIVKQTHTSGSTTLVLYIVSGITGEKATAFINNPNDDEKYISIFRTFRFL